MLWHTSKGDLLVFSIADIFAPCYVMWWLFPIVTNSHEAHSHIGHDANNERKLLFTTSFPLGTLAGTP